MTEIHSQGEKCFLNCIYHSTSQSHNEFDDFCSKVDLLLSNINHEFPLCSFVTGDFNARCSRWWQNDITDSAGQEIDSPTLSVQYKHIIDKPTHFINNSMLCIDLLVCTNQNTISKYVSSTTKRSLLYYHYLLIVILFQTTAKKQIFLITFLFLYAHL